MNIETFFNIINIETNFAFGLMLITIIWLLIYSQIRIKTDIKISFMVSSLSTAIISVLLAYLSFINDTTLLIIWILAVGSIVLITIEE